jgi:hypothetical protein
MRGAPADRVEAEPRGVDVGARLKVVDRSAEIPRPPDRAIDLLVGGEIAQRRPTVERPPKGRDHDSPPRPHQELVRESEVLDTLHRLDPGTAENDHGLIRRHGVPGKKQMRDHPVVGVGGLERHGLVDPQQRRIVGVLHAGVEC